MPPRLDEDDDGEVLLEDLVIEEYAPTTLRQPFGLPEVAEAADISRDKARSGSRVLLRAAFALMGLGAAAFALGAWGRQLAPKPRFAWLRFGS